MHEMKVNTNIGDVSSSEAKNPVLTPEYAGSIATPVGVHAPSTITPVLSQSEQISRLAGIADAIGAMLGTFPLLPVACHDDALAVSTTLADELAQTLAALVGGAA